MTKNKLFQLITTFNKEDWAWIRSNVGANYTENSQKLTLWKLLVKYGKDKSGQKLNDEYLWQKEFSHLSKKSFQNLLSLIQKDIIEALTIKEIQSDTAAYQSYQLKMLRNRGLYQWHDNTQKQQKQKKNKELTRYTSFWEFKNSMDTYMSNHPIKYKNGSEALNQMLHNWEDHKTDMDLLLKMMGAYREALFQEDWSNIDDIKSDRLRTDLQKAFHHLIVIRTQDNEKSKEFLERFLFESDYPLSKDMKILFSHGLLNYNIVHETNVIKRATDTFKINKYQDQNNLFVLTGLVSSLFFVNALIIASCSLINDIEWAEYFMEKYQSKLPINEREKTCLLGSIYILHAKGEYDKALNIIQTLSLNTGVWKIELRTLELINLLEAGIDRDLIKAKLTNTKSYYNREKESMSIRTKKALVLFLEAYELVLNGKIETLKIKFQNKDYRPLRWLWLLEKSGLVKK